MNTLNYELEKLIYLLNNTNKVNETNLLIDQITKKIHSARNRTSLDCIMYELSDIT